MIEYVIRRISREQAAEWGLPYDPEEELHREQIYSRRWHSVHELVFRAPDDGETYFIHYNKGLTEMQDEDPFDDEDEVVLTMVEPYERTITGWRKVRK